MYLLFFPSTSHQYTDLEQCALLQTVICLEQLHPILLSSPMISNHYAYAVLKCVCWEEGIT